LLLLLNISQHLADMACGDAAVSTLNTLEPQVMNTSHGKEN